jgi:hypothetical protein
MADRNPPVLVGNVPLLHVQTLTMNEGYRIERIAGSTFSQAIAPTTKTISIEAMLVGPERLRLKKELEALALVSRVLVAATAPALALAGVPVVSGMTISLDMQITELRFTQSVQKREALDVHLTLQHVPRSSTIAIVSEVADLALARGTATTASPPLAASLPRTAREPL